MAHWDYKTGKIHVFPTTFYNERWLEYDCGCSAGITWGGDYPVECKDCRGSGCLFVHIETGVMALWPGGPLAGKMPKIELALKILSAHRTKLGLLP